MEIKETHMEFKKNDTVTVEIQDMSHDGSGIGKAEGYTLFIKDAVIGDTVEVKSRICIRCLWNL